MDTLYLYTLIVCVYTDTPRSGIGHYDSWPRSGKARRRSQLRALKPGDYGLPQLWCLDRVATTTLVITYTYTMDYHNTIMFVGSDYEGVYRNYR